MTISPAQAGTPITAAFLNQFIPGSWVSCNVATSAGWSNHGGGSSPLSVRLINPVTMHMVGSLNPGTLTAGTNFGSLPSSTYYPSTVQPGSLHLIAGTGAGTTVPFLIYPNGHIQVGPVDLTSGVTEVMISTVIGLDI